MSDPMKIVTKHTAQVLLTLLTSQWHDCSETEHFGDTFASCFGYGAFANCGYINEKSISGSESYMAFTSLISKLISDGCNNLLVLVRMEPFLCHLV
eukprot:4853391-Amphidinium_carterae.1